MRSEGISSNKVKERAYLIVDKKEEMRIKINTQEIIQTLKRLRDEIFIRSNQITHTRRRIPDGIRKDFINFGAD